MSKISKIDDLIAGLARRNPTGHNWMSAKDAEQISALLRAGQGMRKRIVVSHYDPYPPVAWVKGKLDLELAEAAEAWDDELREGQERE